MSDLARFKAAIVKTWSAQVWDGLIDAMQARLAPLEEQLDIERATTERIVQRALGVIDEAIAPLLTAMQDGLATATTELAAIDEAYRTDGEARVDGIINPLVAQAQADLAAAALALAMLEAGVAANSAKLGGELPGFYLDPANFAASANVKTMLAAANNAAIRAAVGAQAALGYTPLNKAADTMLGPLLLAASDAGGAGLNVAPGVAPSSPNNGDTWPTSAGWFYRYGNVTYQAATLTGVETLTNKTLTSPTINGGTITGITDLAIADGGTGASSAAQAFSNLKQAATDTATGVVELATLAEVQTGTDTTRAVTPAGVAAAAIGYGQIWQNVTGSRAASTSYQNTTGKPIQVYINGGVTGNNVAFQVSTDNATWVPCGTVNDFGTVYSIVQPTHYYRLNGGSFSAWSEMRA